MQKQEARRVEGKSKTLRQALLTLLREMSAPNGVISILSLLKFAILRTKTKRSSRGFK